MHDTLQQHWQHVRQRPVLMGIYALCLLVAVLFFFRYCSAVRLKNLTRYEAIPTVSVIKPKPASQAEHITLPGSLLAWHEAPVFARANGYLKQWYVDIGYHVKKGDVLAVIARPELDAQLKEAEDFLKQTIAENNLAQITARRWNNLVKTDSVSRQANDDKTYQARALAAAVSKARANVENLRAYVSFEKVVAPFTGTISLRQTDIGALVNVGSNPAQATPLFRIVQTDLLRLYVNIPQTYATRIKPNMQVSMQFAEHPGQTFVAQLLKTAEAIDPITLTLQAEFKVINKEGVLLPGSYSVVDLSIDGFPESIILPVNTLIFRAEGLQVAVVEPDDKVCLRTVKMGTDFGKYIQINSGIRPGERVIINPLDSLYQGQRVRIAKSALTT